MLFSFGWFCLCVRIYSFLYFILYRLKTIQLKEKIQSAVNGVRRAKPQKGWRGEQVKFGVGAGAGKFYLWGSFQAMTFF
jgi:hypothetical protein